MAVYTHIEGAAELENVLKELPRAVQKKVLGQAVRAGGLVLKKEMRLRAPYDPKRKRGTHLRDAIVVRKMRGTNDIYEIGPDKWKAPHAHLVEFGTGPRKFKRPHFVRLGGKIVRVTHAGRMPARPFVRPAVDAKKDEAIDKIGERLGAGIEREALRLSGRYRTLSKSQRRLMAK